MTAATEETAVSRSATTSGLRTPRAPASIDTTALNRVRCRRGRDLFAARSADIWRVGPYAFRVPSQSGGGFYTVSLEPGSERCSCPDYARYRQAPGDFHCKHLYAALLWEIKIAAGRPRLLAS